MLRWYWFKLIFCDYDIGLIFDLYWCDVAVKFILGWFFGGAVATICWNYVVLFWFYVFVD
jgi:hypothetical protein